MHKAIQEAKNNGCRAVGIDCDNTVWKDPVAETIGYGFLERELRSHNINNVLTGLWTILKIKANSFNHNPENEARSLEYGV